MAPNKLKNGKKGRNAGKRKGRNGNSNGGGVRSRGDKVLGQGVSAYPLVPFRAAERKTGPTSTTVSKYMQHGLNARSLLHLGLPRPVGPYTVIRTTRTFSTNAAAVIVGTYAVNTGTGTWKWRNVCAIEDVARGTAINGASNSKYFSIPFATIGAGSSAFECCPAALSVQVINNEALQTSTGTALITRVNQSLDLNGKTDTWDNVCGGIMEFFPPRVCSAGKLALRGVETTSYPLNMSEFSFFAPMEVTNTDDVFTVANGLVVPAAFAPIVIYQPTATTFNLTYVVTVEWRVRFDPLNMAAGSHTHHAHTPDSWFSQAIKDMSTAGHGVCDIVENVANMGSQLGGLVNRVGRMTGRLNGMRMLTNG